MPTSGSSGCAIPRSPTRSTSSPSTSCPTGRTSRSASTGASPTARCSIEKHILDIYKQVQARFPGKKIVIGETGWPSDGRMRSDARPGRVEQVRYFSTVPRARRPRALRLQHRRGLRPVLEGAPGRHRRRHLGPARCPARATSSSSASRWWPSRNGVCCLPCRRCSTALVVVGFASLRRPPPARSIAIFAVFAQLVATCYVEAIWTDLFARLLFRARGRRGLLGGAARDCSATRCCAASPTA